MCAALVVVLLELSLHVVTGTVLGIAFLHDNYFVPPLAGEYPVCPPLSSYPLVLVF